MSKSSLQRRFIPLGAWAPDSPEFAPGFLDQIVNALPVFGVNRVVQRLLELSRCEEDRRVTGTYVHRISLDQALDIMQPELSEAPPKEGFQSSPNQNPPMAFYVALRGLTADAASTVLLIPHSSEKILFGAFSAPSRVWNNVDPLIATFQFRISPGYEGTYSFTIEIGTVTAPFDDPNNFTMLTGGSFTKSGNLEDAPDHLDGQMQSDQISVLNADISDPGNALHYAWRIRQTITLTSTETERSYNITTVRGAAATDNAAGIVSFWADEGGSNLPADFVDSLVGMVAGVWTPDDATFARSVEIWSTSTTGYGFWMKADLDQFVVLQNHKIRFRYSISRTGAIISVGMFQGYNRGIASLIKQWTNLGVAFNDQIVDLTLDDDDFINNLHKVTDWEDVWFFFFAHRPPPSSTPETLTLRPIDVFTDITLWELVGPSYVTAISDASDLTGIRQPLASTTAFFQVRINPFSGPREAVAAVRLHFRAANQTGTTFVALGLAVGGFGGSPPGFGGPNEWSSLENGDLVEVPLDPTFNDYSITVPFSELAQFNNFANTFLRLWVILGSSGRLEIADVWVELETGYSTRTKLIAFTYFAPIEGDAGVGAPIDVSWLRLDGPSDVESNQADTLKAYLGTVEEPDSATQEGKIFEVTSPVFSTWEDVSRTAGYESNNRDKSWHFSGYGSAVIATNYVDPVQVKYETATDFDDLIGNDVFGVAIPDYAAMGGETPRSRFVATIGSFLCLANIDPLSAVGSGQPYSFWCSRHSGPQYFHLGLIEWQSSIFQMVSTPGEITGLVGGLEYGLIFKENSVTRMDYTGLPEIFHPTQISGQQGTVQPRSIVEVENDVYFFGGGGIYAVRDGRMVEEVSGQGAVRKYLFDVQHEGFSLSSLSPALESEASVRVVGGYDHNSGCILWAYMTKAAGAAWFSCDAVIAYSPRENRFSFLHGPKDAEYTGDDRIISASDIFTGNSLELQGFLTLGNRSVSGETHLMRTILAVNSMAPRISSFSGTPSYEQMYRSNTYASTFFGAKVGVEIEIHKVRPIIAVERQSFAPKHTVWIEANQSPAIGDGTGRVISLSSQQANKDGWIDVGSPLSGEFFKFALVFEEFTEQIVKEVHGWQVVYRVAGDH